MRPLTLSLVTTFFPIVLLGIPRLGILSEKVGNTEERKANLVQVNNYLKAGACYQIGREMPLKKGDYLNAEEVLETACYGVQIGGRLNQFVYVVKESPVPQEVNQGGKKRIVMVSRVRVASVFSIREVEKSSGVNL